MALDYTTYVAQISNIMSVDPATTQFQTMLPGMIAYAEQRIYRELDLLNTVVRNDTATLIAFSRNFTLPTTSNGNFITLQGINLVTPAGVATIATGVRNPLQPATRDFLDSVWNSATGATLPKLFAMIDQFNIIVGPWPDAAYQVEVIGTIRPNPLTSTNSTTFLTDYLPDLFIAASMIFASGYQRDFGSQADNPAQAVSWESQYEKLFASANAEEMRKKFAGPGWTSLSAIANPPVR
jgi:hypothetical protein